MTTHFYWDIDAILKAITPKTKLIFICSPNNPTGNQIAEEDLLHILALGFPTFFDEAYYELENEAVSRASLIKPYPHMLVNRTMSKAFGLAGFRLGYLLCDPKLASYFNRVRFPWNVSLISIAAALAGLGDSEDQKQKRENTIRGREYIFEEINKMPGMRAYPAEGNFVLIDASILGKNCNEIRDKMASRGIFIRPMSGHNMAQGFIRVTVGTPEQNRLFIGTIGGGRRWRVKGLTVSPSLAPAPAGRAPRGLVSLGERGGPESAELVVEDCFVYSVLDTAAWTGRDWVEKPASGIWLGRHGRAHVARNNTSSTPASASTSAPPTAWRKGTSWPTSPPMASG